MKKRVRSAVTAAVFVSCLLSQFPSSDIHDIFSVTEKVSVSAESVYNGITYSVNYNNEVTVTGCESGTEVLEIPSVIEGNPVTRINSYAFENCTSIVSAVIPDSVTDIGSYAFYGCTSLEKVKLSSSLTQIRDYTFAKSNLLKSCDIPEGITRIGEGAFWKCESIEKIILPDTVTELGLGAFQSCYGATELKISGGLKVIGSSAFCACKGLTKLSIPEGVESIESKAFSESSGIKSISFPKTLKSIGSFAFWLCESLETLELPSSLETLDTAAFQECYALKEAVIPAGVTVIPDQLFSSCKLLESVKFGENVTKISSSAFRGSKIAENDTLYIGKWLIKAGVRDSTFYIKEGTEGIADNAFSSSHTLTQIKLPDSIKNIGAGAFSYCDKLSSIVIPDSVTEIPDNTFSGCSELSSVEFGNNVRSVGKNAFYSAKILENQEGSLKYINGILVYADPEISEAEISADTVGIAAGVFSGNTGITEINLPDSIEFIGASCFENCSSLKKVKLSEKITVIPDTAFMDCESLEEINFPEKLRSVEYRAFGQCKFLEIPAFPESLEKIGFQAFCGCRNTKYLYIPETVTEIGEMAAGYYWDTTGRPCRDNEFTLIGKAESEAEKYAEENNVVFRDADKLSGTAGENIKWSFDISNAELVFSGSGNMTEYSEETDFPWKELVKMTKSVSLSDEITSISSHAFYGFSKITSVKMPAMCTDIGSYAFCGCSVLKDITLPDSLQKIDDNAFAQCYLISGIELPAALTDISDSAFFDMTSLSEINVKKGNEKYSSDSGILLSADGTELIKYPSGRHDISFEIPSGIKIIGAGAFQNASINSITLPDGLESIGENAFSNSSLTSVLVPESVSVIGANAFYNCKMLRKAVFLARDAGYASNMFGRYVLSPLHIYAYLSEGKWASARDYISSDNVQWTDLAAGKAEGVQIEKQSLELEAGSSEILNVITDPMLSSDLIWNSSDQNVACVMSDGKVIAFAEGECDITVSSADGLYSSTCKLKVSGNTDFGKGVFELSDDEYGSSSSQLVSSPVFSDKYGGAYFISGSELKFWSLYTGEYYSVEKFGSQISSSFVQGDMLYVLSSSQQTAVSQISVYDLSEQRIKNIITVSSFTGRAVGADQSGRICLAGTDNESGNSYIILLGKDGKELSRTYTTSEIRAFSAFDSSNGNYYFEADYNWHYWGYDHSVRSLRAGRITDGEILVNDNEIPHNLSMGMITIAHSMMLYQYGVNTQTDSVRMVNDRYLTVNSGFYNSTFVIDSSTFDPMDPSPDFTAIISHSEDMNSYGNLSCYSNAQDALITCSGINELSQYSMEDSSKQASFSTKHNIYSVSEFRDHVAVFEKEYDEESGKTICCLELIDWVLPEKIEITGEHKMNQGTSQKLGISLDSDFSVEYTWSSSDPSVLSIDENGYVFAFKNGEAVISVETASGLSDSFAVTVEGSGTVMPGTVITGKGTASSNASDNDYTTYYASTVNSYLHLTDDGMLERIEYIDKNVIIEKYNENGSVLSESMKIEAPLAYFGGCFTGEKYNYLVFGDENPAEDDSKEVIRILRYSKDWKQTGSASVYGSNTYIPFDAGSLRMTETSGKLYIHTCHEMYSGGEEVHHQANMTFVFDQESMKQLDAYYDVMNIQQAGYVSHSFNQYIQTDGEFVYRVDHGDASPRAVSITKCRVDGKVEDVSYTLPLSIKGMSGANATGVSVGGFELSSDKCLIAGNSVDQSGETYSAYGQRNIFVTVSDKNFSGNKCVWITNYSAEDGIKPSTPQLVKISDQAFLLMWEEKSASSSETVTKMVTLNGSGVPVCDIYSKKVRLSDCQPFADSDGMVHWYYTSGSGPVFCSVNPYALESFAPPSEEPAVTTTVTTRPAETTAETTAATKPVTTVTTKPAETTAATKPVTTVTTKPAETTAETTVTTKPATTETTKLTETTVTEKPASTVTEPVVTTVSETEISVPVTTSEPVTETSVYETTVPETSEEVQTTSVTVPNLSGLKGDITGDGRIGSADLVRMLQHLTGEIPLSEEERSSADINKNETIDVFDLIRLKKIILIRIFE